MARGNGLRASEGGILKEGPSKYVSSDDAFVQHLNNRLVSEMEKSKRLSPTEKSYKKARAEIKNLMDSMIIAREVIVNNKNKVVSGDLSAFEPSLSAADRSGTSTGQAYLYSVLKKAGIGNEGVFSDKVIDEAWDKYGDGRKRETYIAFDDQGRRVVAVTGKKDLVDAPILDGVFDSKNGMELWGMRDWHNHPLSASEGRVIGGNPSGDDIAGGISMGVFQSVVDAREGRYRLTMTDSMKKRLQSASGSGEVARIAKAASSAWEAITKSVEKVAPAWETDEREAKKYLSALSKYVKLNNREIEELVGFKYEFEPRKSFDSENSF